ncbi:MAG: hypothetical protein ABWY14_10355 [Tardiphaga sp.]
MMAMRNPVQDEQPGEIEALLPWHAAGTLNARDTRRVDEALAGDPDLARQYEAIREEYAETILLNESLGAPSSRAMQKLFAAIDAEPARDSYGSFNIYARVAGFFARLSPRTLAATAAVGALALLLQAGVIGAILMKRAPGTFQTASYEPVPAPGAPAAPITRSLAPESGLRAFVRFAPAAKMSDITALLEAYQGTIVDGGKDGLFRLQFGSKPMTPDQIAGLVRRLEAEKIVSMAVPAQ